MYMLVLGSQKWNSEFRLALHSMKKKLFLNITESPNQLQQIIPSMTTQFE